MNIAITTTIVIKVNEGDMDADLHENTEKAFAAAAMSGAQYLGVEVDGAVVVNQEPLD